MTANNQDFTLSAESPADLQPVMGVGSTALLGSGSDLVGRQVQCWDEEWTIEGKNYLGDWDVVRYESRPSGRYRIKSSISAKILPVDHPHYAVLLPNVQKSRFVCLAQKVPARSAEKALSVTSIRIGSIVLLGSYSD